MSGAAGPDIEVGEINTRVEVFDQAKGGADVERIVELVLQRLRDGAHEQSLRRQDDRIRDRSWKTDVKPE
jgi:hypothetical protein